MRIFLHSKLFFPQLFILPLSFSSEVRFQSHLFLLILFIYLRFCLLILLTSQPSLLHCNLTRRYLHYISYFGMIFSIALSLILWAFVSAVSSMITLGSWISLSLLIFSTRKLEWKCVPHCNWFCLQRLHFSGYPELHFLQSVTYPEFKKEQEQQSELYCLLSPS